MLTWASRVGAMLQAATASCDPMSGSCLTSASLSPATCVEMAWLRCDTAPRLAFCASVACTSASCLADFALPSAMNVYASRKTARTKRTADPMARARNRIALLFSAWACCFSAWACCSAAFFSCSSRAARWRLPQSTIVGASRSWEISKRLSPPPGAGGTGRRMRVSPPVSCSSRSLVSVMERPV
jgi:hypothetical protein